MDDTQNNVTNTGPTIDQLKATLGVQQTATPDVGGVPSTPPTQPKVVDTDKVEVKTPTSEPSASATAAPAAAQTPTVEEAVVVTPPAPEVKKEEPAPITPPVVVTAPVPAPAPVPTPTPAPAPVTPPTPAPVAPVVQEEVAVEAEPVVVDEDNVQVAKLNGMLAEIKVALSKPGKIPPDFRDAAKKVAIMTQFVITFPKVPVLDALLKFVQDNLNGVCAPSNFLKGGTTLGETDEQQSAYLYLLFHDIASKRLLAINSASVIQVLKKQEFVGYYNRKQAGIRAVAAAAA